MTHSEDQHDPQTPRPAQDAERLGRLLHAVIAEQMQRSPAFRELAVELASWVLDQADATDSPTTPATADRAAPPTPSQPLARVNPAPATITGPTARVPLVIGGSSVEVAVRGDGASIMAARASAPRPDAPPPADAPAPIDLDLISARTALKAEACRLAIRRRAAAGDSAAEHTVLEIMNQQIARAKSMTDCFLWSFWPHETQPSDERLDAIADCYQSLSSAVALCARLTDANASARAADEMTEAFTLMAEAGSALRIALGWSWLRSDDVDQEESHLWLRHETEVRGIFVPRHMRLDDPADPAEAPSVIERARAINARLDTQAARTRQIDAAINRLRYHAKRFPRDAASARADTHDAKRINDAMDELTQSLGLAATHARIREALAGITADAFPDDAPANASVLAAIGATAAAVPAAAPDQPRAWSERVTALRPFLAEGSVVIIGGEPRADAIARIEDAFGLAEVVWVPLTEHGTGQPMRAPIARPETLLVIVIIKLAGHLHAEEARAYARDADKPCVLLTAGYNPEQIASAIEDQALARLKSRATTG